MLAPDTDKHQRSLPDTSDTDRSNHRGPWAKGHDPAGPRLGRLAPYPPEEQEMPRG